MLQSFSPATGEALGAVPVADRDTVRRVVSEVAQVQPIWGALPPADRARYLGRAAQVVIDHTDELCTLIAREQGRPRVEAHLEEVAPTVAGLRWLADHGRRILAERRVPAAPPWLAGRHHVHVYEPLGVLGVLTPFDHPWSIPAGDVATALMAGNGVVLKPSSQTAIVGQRVQALFERAGVPEGLVRVVHGPEAGEALVGSAVAKVLFRGSSANGRAVAEACARELKGCALGLSGKDAMLVLSDAPLQRAIAGALRGGFANAGQSAAGVQRVYVMREVSERFLAGVVTGAARLRPGDPLDWASQLGPMTSTARRDRVDGLVVDAVRRGATLH